MDPGVRRLLRRVASRQRACAVGARFYCFVLLLAALYSALLLCSRLLALIPNWFAPVGLVSPVAAALAMAVAFHRRPTATAAARLVDKRMATDDLYLTAALIESSAGQYQPLVLRDAEAGAGSVPPQAVVPFKWGAKARRILLVLAVLLAASMFLPQLDPFGRGEQRRAIAERRRQLEDSRQATALRIAFLKKKAAEGDLAEQVPRAVARLKETFNATRPAQKEGNLKRLSARQQELGELWRKASEKKLKPDFRQSYEAQKFGAGSEKKVDQWRRELRKGETKALKKEIAELKDAVQKLTEMPEGVEKKELAQQVRQRLRELADFAANETNSPSLNSALQRALDQLAMAGMAGISGPGLEALAESLDLTELELSSLAESLEGLQSLEDALEALQLAKLLNEWEGLDGEMCKSCEGIADYAALYAKLMEGRCGSCGCLLGEGGVCSGCGGRGMGLGMRGAGIGVGGLAPEDTEAETAFKTEKSRSALTAGKILLSLKTRGLSDPGQARVDYEQHVDEVKQGVSEAILHEQVPPAYHEAIQDYFDSIGEPHETAAQ